MPLNSYYTGVIATSAACPATGFKCWGDVDVNVGAAFTCDGNKIAKLIHHINPEKPAHRFIDGNKKHGAGSALDHYLQGSQ